MERLRVAGFERCGDVREVFVGLDGDDVVLYEEVSGPSAQVALGEKNRGMTVRLTPRAASEVMSEIGFSGEEGSLWDHLSDERYDLTDLVCLCSERGIPCVVEAGNPCGGRG